MDKLLYRLTLDSYSTPSFCSGSTNYVGTLKQIGSFIEALRNDEDFAENQKRLINTWDIYKNGNHDVTYNAAYQENQFLVQAAFYGAAKTTLTDYEWEHLNIWELPYYMRCSRAENTHIWVSYQESYCRWLRVKFTNLQFKDLKGVYTDIGEMFWGYPHMIENQGVFTYNRLYIFEKAFDSKEKMLFDMTNIYKSPDINYQYVMNDIFGDG